VSADLAFPPKKLVQSPGPILDKEVRAIFLMTLVRILSNYRSSLQFSRIHPEVQTKLNRQEFLQSADPQDFKVQLSRSQSFQAGLGNLSLKNMLGDRFFSSKSRQVTRQDFLRENF
jgi:hypothetical protein